MRRLYRSKRDDAVAGRYSFETFEEYVESRWEFDKSRATRLIEAASIVEKMVPIGTVLPSRESHVRPLLKLENDEERAAANCCEPK